MILNVARISAANAAILKDARTFDGNQYFNPIQDLNGNWIISLLEAGFVDRDEIFFSIINWEAPEIEEEL